MQTRTASCLFTIIVIEIALLTGMADELHYSRLEAVEYL
jgi:hypothetical protein